ncbi:MAG: hypothetical protein ABJN14_01870 [Paracoccaceae bacterium]
MSWAPSVDIVFPEDGLLNSALPTSELQSTSTLSPLLLRHLLQQLGDGELAAFDDQGGRTDR